MDIKEALHKLDPENDAHWTADGLPRMDAVEALVGNDSITRAQVTEADPDFNREAAHARQKDQDQDETPDEGEAQEDEAQALKAQLNELEEALGEIHKEVDETSKRQAALKAEAQALEEKIQELTPKEHPQVTIMNYIKSQNELRARRNAERARLVPVVDGWPVDNPRGKKQG